MGIVFGKTGTKGPDYNVLYKASTGYELRSYPGYLTAEVLMNDANGNNGFGILAKYIGVFGKPENIASQSMDMTHPVIMDSSDSGQKISMTSPVINNKNIMKFVLPAHYTKVSQAPVPTDQRVTIKETPGHYVAVLGFSGWYTPEKGLAQFKKLVKLLKQDNYLKSKPVTTTQPSTTMTTATTSTDELTDEDYKLDWQVAQYHPPFTLPFCRLNEIWIKLTPKSSPALQTLLKDAPAASIIASSVIEDEPSAAAVSSENVLLSTEKEVPTATGGNECKT